MNSNRRNFKMRSGRPGRNAAEPERHLLKVAAGLRWSEQNLFLKPAGLGNRAGDLRMMCTGEKVKRRGRNPPPLAQP
jgi:hypothetical protein